jgi:hypothetical protein
MRYIVWRELTGMSASLLNDGELEQLNTPTEVIDYLLKCMLAGRSDEKSLPLSR